MMRALALSLLLIAASAATAQRRPRPNTEPGSDYDILNAAVATFDGTLRSLDKKRVLLEMGEDQTLTIEVNRKTRYFRGAKAIMAREISVGAIVTVEARKVANQLLAVAVRVREPAADTR